MSETSQQQLTTSAQNSAKKSISISSSALSSISSRPKPTNITIQKQNSQTPSISFSSSQTTTSYQVTPSSNLDTSNAFANLQTPLLETNLFCQNGDSQTDKLSEPVPLALSTLQAATGEGSSEYAVGIKPSEKSSYDLQTCDLDALFNNLTAEINQVEGHIATAMRLKKEAAERDMAINAMLVQSVDARLAAARPIIEKIRQVNG